MDNTASPSFPVPRWAWLPTLLGLLLPIAHWGALEALVGLSCAASCPAIAMRSQWRERTRINLIVAVAFLCWAFGGGFVGGKAVLATQNTAPPSTAEKLANEAYRQKIFAHAMNRKSGIKEVEQEIRDARRQGKDVSFLKSKLKMLQDS